MSTRHAEPEIDAFLAIGGYADADEWMADSDYHQDADGDWLTEDDDPIWPTDAIAGAMEACHEDDMGELSLLEQELADLGGRETFGYRHELQAKIVLYRTRLGLA